MNKLALLVLLAVAVLPLASAWWCTGHMIVASIAKANIRSSLASQIESIIRGLSESGPFRESPDMVQAACWADDLKRNQRAMAGWHFIDQPYAPTSYQVPQHYALQEINVATVIPELQNGIYKYPNKWEMAYAVANLIHFVGDLHQPLHCAELFTSQYPNGDRGGNDINVTVPSGNQTELHAVWDSVCWTQTDELWRPLDSNGYNTLNGFVNQYSSAYPKSSFSSTEIEAIKNTTQVALDSLGLAINYAYAHNTITFGMSLPQSYLDQCHTIAGRQLALGGYRLAHALEYAFGGSSDTLGERIHHITRGHHH